MVAKITIKDKDGKSHTWIFKQWKVVGNSFCPGDNIRLLLNTMFPVIEGVFVKVEDDKLFIKDSFDKLTSYPLPVIMGVNKPKTLCL